MNAKWKRLAAATAAIAVTAIPVKSPASTATFTISQDTLYCEAFDAPGPVEMVQAALVNAGIDSVQAIGACVTWSVFENRQGPVGSWIWQALRPVQEAGFTGKQPIAKIYGLACGTLPETFQYRFLEWVCGDGWCANPIFAVGTMPGCATNIESKSWSLVKGLYR